MRLKNILYAASLIVSCHGEDKKDAPFDCERGALVKEGSVTHYPVDGSTCEEAANNLMEPYPGETECNLEVDYSGSFAEWRVAEKHEKCCRASISDIINDTYATVLLPHWEGCDPCFDQFYTNLVAHEQGHVDYCNEAGRTLEYRVRNIPPKTICIDIDDATNPCDLAWQEIENEFNAIFGEVSNDLDQKDKQYDHDTNHGETQGATLNCKCDH